MKLMLKPGITLVKDRGELMMLKKQVFSDLEMFSSTKPHFKGNLHTHSIISDGKKAPKEVVALYQALGYDFLAFTEHETYSWWQELNQQDFLLLPGIEIEAKALGPYQCHHLVGIGSSKVKTNHLERFDNHGFVGQEGGQALINTLHDEDYFRIYCHPVWSRQSFPAIADFMNFNAIEVYNHSCYLENHTGYASSYWDEFLRAGKLIWGVATDDSHQNIEDYGGGWVVVNAASLEIDAIRQALYHGKFYASNGPVIEAYGLKDGEVYVRCSPCRSIHFVAFERRGRSFHQSGQKQLTEASHKLHGDEKYVRIEVIDHAGNTAWSNPLFFS